MKKTPEKLELVRKLQKENYTLAAIAQYIGVSRRTICEWTSEDVRIRSRASKQRQRAREADEGPAPRGPSREVRPSEEKVKELQRLIPEDTRDFTGRFFDDPIPGDPRRPWLSGG